MLDTWVVILLTALLFSQFVDDLLTKSRVCATTLPKINPRTFLEDEDRLESRESALGEELDELDNDSEEHDGHESDGSNGREPNGRADGNGHLDSDGAERSDDSMD